MKSSILLLKQTGLKYKFILLTITTIVITVFLGGFALHTWISVSGAYSPFYLMVVSGFYLLMGVGGTFAISRYMIQPVVYLTEKVYEVKQGNLDVQIAIEPRKTRMDEMDHLFEGFQHMVTHLKMTIEELTHAKEKAERISQELFNSKSRLEAIFNGISDGIMILDKDYRIISANPVIEGFMKRPMREIIGEHCYTMCNGTNSHCSFCRASITFQYGEHVSSYCTKNLNENGQERILEIHDFPLYNEAGEVEQIIEYVKDVTDAVQMQARLESSHRLAEIGEMAAKVAHEVRNPLNAIKGATHYLQSCITDPEIGSYIQLIEEQVERVNHVATELLDLSRPLKPAFQPGRMEQVIEKALLITRNQLNEKAIHVIQEVDPRLPDIPLDEHQMERALVNLILNAIDAMDVGGNLRIQAFPEHAGNGDWQANSAIRLILQDDGCGIEPMQCDEIFKPFYTTKTRGSGLGLTIVKKIVEHHQGEIEVNSLYRQGTEIQITLPLHPKKHEDTKHYLSH